jgi:hypothetical protein
MKLVMLIAALLCGAAQAAEADDAVSQARHFIKKGWHTDAVRDLESAIGTPSGRASFEVHSLLSQVYYSLRDAQKAQAFAERAIALGTDPAQVAEMERFAKFLKENFGLLHIESPYPGMHSALTVESAFPILDPDVAAFFESLRTEWREKTALPLSIGFPVGNYRVNGLLVEVKAGKESTLTMTMKSLGASGLSALQVSRVELSIGPGVITSSRTQNLRPSLDVQLSISQPIGAWIVGAQFDYSVRSFSVEGEGLVADPLSYTAGLRFGREFLIGGPLALRPSLGYRYGYIPGIALACESSDPLDPFKGPYTCRNPDKADGTPDLKVYAVARTHLPFMELSLDYRHAGRTTAVGLGVKLVGEFALGRISSEDSAIVHATGEEIAYATEDDRVTGASLRMLANFSFAF